MPKLNKTLKGEEIKRVVFLDIDDTIFLSRLKTATYTGHSADRWHAFVELLVNCGSLVGIITNKSRADHNNLRGGKSKNIFNGLPDLTVSEFNSRYDDFGYCLFARNKEAWLRDLLSPELIYFMDQGQEGSKVQAMLHA